MWVVSGWKTVRRAAGLRQNLIALLAYIYEPYSSRSKLFRLLWTPIRDVPAGGAGCGMAVLAMILTTGCTTRLIRRKSQGYARPAPARLYENINENYRHPAIIRQMPAFVASAVTIVLVGIWRLDCDASIIMP